MIQKGFFQVLLCIAILSSSSRLWLARIYLQTCDQLSIFAHEGHPSELEEIFELLHFLCFKVVGNCWDHGNVDERGGGWKAK